jgi:hypothetical protein
VSVADWRIEISTHIAAAARLAARDICRHPDTARSAEGRAEWGRGWGFDIP